MELRLREALENADSAVITLWHAKENDRVVTGQELFEISTDKATFDVQSPCDGVLAKIMKKEGETVGMDEVIAEVDDIPNGNKTRR